MPGNSPSDRIFAVLKGKERSTFRGLSILIQKSFQLAAQVTVHPSKDVSEEFLTATKTEEVSLTRTHEVCSVAVEQLWQDNLQNMYTIFIFLISEDTRSYTLLYC